MQYDLNSVNLSTPKNADAGKRWVGSRTAIAPFLECGMTQAQATNYFKMHQVPMKWEPALPKYCDGDIEKLFECDKSPHRKRVWDMDAVRKLVKVYEINQARRMDADW